MGYQSKTPSDIEVWSYLVIILRTETRNTNSETYNPPQDNRQQATPGTYSQQRGPNILLNYHAQHLKMHTPSEILLDFYLYSTAHLVSVL